MNIDISGKKHGRVALGNLSNFNLNIFTSSNAKSPLEILIPSQKTRNARNTPSISKTNTKFQSCYFKQNDPENNRYYMIDFEGTFLENLDSENPIMNHVHDAAKSQKKSSSQLKKEKNISGVSTKNKSSVNLNKKRNLNALRSISPVKEDRFGRPYNIYDEIFVEDHCTKKIKDVVNRVGFTEEFKDIFTSNDIATKHGVENCVNIYEDFAIDLSLYNGKIPCFPMLTYLRFTDRGQR